MAPAWTLPLIERPDWSAEGALPPAPSGTATAPPPPAPPKGPDLSGLPDFFATYSDILGWIIDPDSFPKVAEYVSFVTGVSSDALGIGLNVVGSVMTAIDQYGESTATTTVGKGIDAAIAGGLDWGLGAIHPALPVVDKGVGLFFEHVVGVKGISIADTLNTSSRATVTLVEGVITGDTRGMEQFHSKSLSGEYGPLFQMTSRSGEAVSSLAYSAITGDMSAAEDFHKKSLAGEYGSVMKAASEAGDYWAENGVVGGLEKFGSAVWSFFGD